MPAAPGVRWIAAVDEMGSPAVVRKPDRTALLAWLEVFKGRLPPDFTWSRDDALRY